MSIDISQRRFGRRRYEHRFQIPDVALFAFLFAASFPVMAGADVGANDIASRIAEVEGIKLHYLTAGHGSVVILLHGYTQTSQMWWPLIPQLADKFMVIAPDLPGIGDSDIPKDDLDMKTAAIRIHALATYQCSGPRQPWREKISD